MTAQNPDSPAPTCMFVGTHEAVLDEKSRLVMPAPFRKDNSTEVLNGDFFVTPHLRGHLIIRPQAVWDLYIGSIQEDAEFTPKEKRAFVRYLYNNSTKLRLDAQHRIVLTQKLRGQLRTENEEPRQNVTLVGCGDHLEIWPSVLYQGEHSSITELSKFLDRFEGL